MPAGGHGQLHLDGRWHREDHRAALLQQVLEPRARNRTVPFGGDYLWITSMGSFAYSVWTDWRNTAAGSDPRESGDGDNDGADVKQCRAFDAASGTYGPDTCPHSGGLDQDIYGDFSP